MQVKIVLTRVEYKNDQLLQGRWEGTYIVTFPLFSFYIHHLTKERWSLNYTPYVS